MPGTEPATFASKAGIREEPSFAQSWSKVPYDDYEGMTQQQYQDSVAPFIAHGRSVPVEVPKGWRRIEGARPGKHHYIHQSTGAITRYPKELYDCKKECWIAKDGTKVSEEDLLIDPEKLAMAIAYGGKVQTAAPAAVAASPAPAAIAAAPAAVEEKKPEPVAEVEVAKPEPVQEEEADEAPPLPPAEPPLPVGLLFPGQGSQYIKMMSGVKDLPAVKEMLAKAQEILGYDILELCLKGPESKLEQTKFCQPAMYIGGLAAVEKLKVDKPDRVDRCQAVAGLSLGEYTALTVAGVFDFETGLKIVKLRGEAMQEAAEASSQSMLSVAGLSQEQLSALCQESCTGPDDVCQIANFLFPSGFSCAGTQSAVEALMKKAMKTEGCLQAKLLKTSGGFHTSLMAPAKEKLLQALRDVEKNMKPPRCDVYMNVTGHRVTPATKPAAIIPMLGEQLVSCVQWEPCMREMLRDGVTEFYECGPMKQLKSMMKRIDTNAFKSTTTCDV